MTAILGKDTQGNKITIEKRDRAEGLYIIGSSGTGKSTLLTSLIQQDIKDNTGLCLLDPHGDLIQRTIELMPPERYEDVILLDISNPTYAFGVNLFACNDINDMEEAENTISQVMYLLDKVYSISSLTPMMNQYFLNLTQTLLYNQPSSFLDIPRLLGDTPHDKKYRAKLAANVPNIQTRRFWASFAENRHHWRTIESISAIENKLDDFFRPVLKTIFGQEITTINMREIMDDPAGKIVLVKMNARWESITKLVGSVIVGQILDAAYSRSDIPVKKRRHFSLYADEFQWFASQDFATLFSEARKYGIGLTIAHQTLEQVDPHIIATCKQAKSIVSFRVSGENAQSLASQFDSTPPIPTETRREPILVVRQNVVDHLLNHGHPHPDVAEFVTKYLQKMKQAEKEKSQSSTAYSSASHPQSYFSNNPHMDVYEYRDWIIIKAMQVLNNFLYGAMKPSFQIDFDGDLNSITRDVSSLFGFSHYYTIKQDLSNKQAKNIRDEIEALEQEKLTIARAYRKEKSISEEAYKKGISIAVEKIKHRDAQLTELIIDTIVVDGVWLDGLSPEYRVGTTNLRLLAASTAKREDLRHSQFFMSLMNLSSALGEQPIMAESGRYEEKPVMQRTYADRQGEIANMLTRLKSMHAYVRVAGEEHAIEITYTQPDSIKRAPVASVIKTITEWNEEDEYIRKRSEVEAEIEARQNDDDGGSPPPPGGASPNEPPKKPDTGVAKQPPQNNPLPIPRKRKINPEEK